MNSTKLVNLLHPNKSAIGGKVEKRLAVELGGRATPASGALEGAKSDIVSGSFRYESKATQNDSMSLKYDWLLKISAEALHTNLTPALLLSFVTGDGRERKRGSWVCIPLDVFQEMTGEEE